jgi:hypothetical protein
VLILATGRVRLRRACVELLESRTLLAVDVLGYRYDLSNIGLNTSETSLTPANVNPTTFGKKFTTTLDGQVYAQPLVKSFVNITRGASQGVHNVLYAATQHGSLYAIDANSGAILWQDSFLQLSDPRVAVINSPSATTGVSTIGANSTTNDVVNTADVNPEIGILSTPAIDPSSNLMYVTMLTKEFRNPATQQPSASGDRHFVQRLYAVDISSGAMVRSTVIADTLKNTSITNTATRYQNYQYFAGPVMNGTGINGTVGTTTVTDGWENSTDPNHPGYNPISSGQIAFNALLQMNRPATTLVNGVIYLAYASHGDNGPYYGWVLAYRASDFALVGVFNPSPTFKGILGSPAAYTAEAGIWQSGSRLASDGTYLYMTTGNGAFDEANANFDANGFPIDHNFGDCVLKLGVDPNSSPASQNGNGWGLKVYDYFTPSNQLKLNQIDADLGSGGVALLPNTASITVQGVTYNHLLITAGKEGRIYLLNRDNLGKFNLTYPKNATSTPYPDPRLYDQSFGEFTTNAINGQIHKMYSAAAYFDGSFYFATSTDPGRRFVLANFPSGTVPPGTTAPTPSQTTSGFTAGTRGPTFTISANGTSNGVVWGLNNNVSVTTDNLLAWDAKNFGAAIFNSNTNSARDSLIGGVSGATGVKFSVPVVANGMVYVGTGGKPTGVDTVGLGTLVGYGLLSSPPPPAAPSQPDLNAASDTGASNSDNFTADNTPTFTGTAVAGSTVSLLIDGNSVGMAVATGGGTYQITASALTDGSHSVSVIATTINGVSTTSATTNIQIITTLPAFSSAVFNYAAVQQTVKSIFTSDVTASIADADLTLTNLNNGNATIPASDLHVQIDAAAKSATWTYTPGTLPDGTYLATIPAEAIEDLAGNHPATDIVFGFSFVNGDVNRDLIVNALDFNALASNYGATSSSFSQGDFNRDGTVNSIDFSTLAANFNDSAPAPPPGTIIAGPPPASAPANLFNDVSRVDEASLLDVIE